MGDLEHVNAEAIHCLLGAGILPVLSPITLYSPGQLLNTHADSVASGVAESLAAADEVEMVFCLDKPGVLLDVEDDASAIPEINPGSFSNPRADGKVPSGMIPKLQNAFALTEAGVSRVRITNVENLSGGTIVVR